MLTVYVLVASVLGFCVLISACFFAVSSYDILESEDWQIFSAVFLIAVFATVIWPLVIPLGILAFLGYGLVNLCRPSVWRQFFDALS